MILAFEHYTSAESRLGRLIKWWERYPYVHVELIFEEHDWVCFSARTKEDGVYLKPFKDVVRTIDHWKGYRLPIVSEAATYEATIPLIGKEFGYSNIANSQVFKNLRTDPNNRFCSQGIYEVLTQTTALPLPIMLSNTVTPKLLHEWVLGMDYPEVNLIKP